MEDILSIRQCHQQKLAPEVKQRGQRAWSTVSYNVIIRILAGLCVAHQHVVVHVDGAAVVDGVPQFAGHRCLAAVRRQTQLEKTCLRRWQAVSPLSGEKQKHQKKHVCDVGRLSCSEWRKTKTSEKTCQRRGQAVSSLTGEKQKHQNLQCQHNGNPSQLKPRSILR